MATDIKKQTVDSMRKLAMKVFIKAILINLAIAIAIGLIVSFEAKDDTFLVMVVFSFIVSIFFIPTYKMAFTTWRNSSYLKKHDMECVLTDVLSFDHSPMYAFILKGKYRPEDICSYVYERKTYSAYIYRMVKEKNSDDRLVVFVDKNADGEDRVFAVPTVYVPDAAEYLRSKDFM